MEGKSDTFTHLVQRFAKLLTKHPDDEETRLSTIIDCDEDLDALRLAQKEVERRVILASRQRNTFSLINTLPVELLVDICHHAVYSGIFVECDVSITLSLVCHRWNQIVNDTPTLWTSIRKSPDLRLKRLLNALEKSKNAPLDINLHSWSLDPEEDGFLSAILPHSERWRELTLERLFNAAKLGTLATVSAPILESFKITFGDVLEWDETRQFDLFGGQSLPKPKSVVVQQLPISWNPSLLCNLTLLEVSNIRSLGPSLDQLLAVLSACPDLQSLFMFDVSFSAQTTSQSQDPIHLQRLRSFELKHLDSAMTYEILATIRAPNCEVARLTFTSRLEGHPMESFFTVRLSHFFNLMQRGTDTDSCNINYHSETAVSLGWTGACDIFLEMETLAFARDTFLWLTEPTETSHSKKPVQLSIDLHGADSQTTRDILSMLEGLGVQSIRLGLYVPAQEALQHLLNSDPSKQGLSRWSFPELHTICINGDILSEDWADFVTALRRRQEDATSSLDDQERPKSITRVIIGLYYVEENHERLVNFRSTYWPNGMDQVRSLLGPEGEVIWYGKILTLEGSLRD